MSLIDSNIEKEKVDSIVLNTVLNGLSAEGDYNFWNEALEWATSEHYFPHLNQEHVLEILRKYESWNEFEKVCREQGEII